ncbi:sporulation protein rmd1 [Elasticomyces elasticus]|nr:sporulation protein rmd1 [Elasticomyces elasticus]KAK4903026.1 sporulation protein rmd1 [Elasticomyces elasticus]KAK5738747.1 sporulation protein rmd1 [Elasticomyces elasticus]
MAALASLSQHLNLLPHQNDARTSQSATQAPSPSTQQKEKEARNPLLSALNSKLRRRNSSGAPLQYQGTSSSSPASKIKSQRTIRTAQELKLLPNPENKEEDEESGREVYSQFTRTKDPTVRRDAATLGEDDRAKLHRVTACCTASSYKMDDLMRFLKARVGTGRGFGVGSSRQNAVTALQGAGVQCVIARSWAFIYSRNQPNLGLLGIVMADDAFYEAAVDRAEIVIDVDGRVVRVAEQDFAFMLSDLEMALWEQGGMNNAFAEWGKRMLDEVTTPTRSSYGSKLLLEPGDDLKW